MWPRRNGQNHRPVSLTQDGLLQTMQPKSAPDSDVSWLIPGSVRPPFLEIAITIHVFFDKKDIGGHPTAKQIQTWHPHSCELCPRTSAIAVQRETLVFLPLRGPRPPHAPRGAAGRLRFQPESPPVRLAEQFEL